MKEKHLEFLQNVITRMNTNSFLLKGWSVVILSALFALAAKDANSNFILISYLPCISFWVLDGFYLHQERMFRKLYESTIEDSNIKEFSMDTKPFKNIVASWFGVCFSRTLLIFHGSLLLVIIITTIILFSKCKLFS